MTLVPGSRARMALAQCLSLGRPGSFEGYHCAQNGARAHLQPRSRTSWPRIQFASGSPRLHFNEHDDSDDTRPDTPLDDRNRRYHHDKSGNLYNNEVGGDRGSELRESAAAGSSRCRRRASVQAALRPAAAHSSGRSAGQPEASASWQGAPMRAAVSTRAWQRRASDGHRAAHPCNHCAWPTEQLGARGHALPIAIQTSGRPPLCLQGQ
jgi:hypothetical protein